MISKNYLKIYTLGIILLSLSKYYVAPQTGGGSFQFSKSAKYIKDNSVSLLQKYDESEYFDLWLAILTGSKTRLNRNWQKKYKNLNLQHLFTPSGLHYSSLFILMTPFRLLNNQVVLSKIKYIHLIIFIFLLFISGLYSFKRMNLFHNIKSFFCLKSSKAFIAMSAIDFLSGSFNQSPYSYSFSFIFLGTLLTFQGNKYIHLPLYLLMSSFLCNYFSSSEVTLISPFINVFISSIFTFIFPIALVVFALEFFSEQAIFLEQILFCFDSIVNFFWKINKNSPAIPFAGLILIIPFFLNYLKIVIVILCLASPEINNGKKLKRISVGKVIMGVPQKRPDRYKVNKKTYTLFFEKVRCKYRVDTVSFSPKCKISK